MTTIAYHHGTKAIFQKLVSEEIKCEICGSGTMAIYGCGWDNDRILCLDAECGAEYVFPTSTSHFYKVTSILMKWSWSNV